MFCTYINLLLLGSGPNRIRYCSRQKLENLADVYNVFANIKSAVTLKDLCIHSRSIIEKLVQIVTVQMIINFYLLILFYLNSILKYTVLNKCKMVD